MEYKNYKNTNYDYDDMNIPINLLNENSDQDIIAQIRLGFIRKVYGILTAQLLFTTFFTAIAMLSDSFKLFLQNHSIIFGIMILLIIVIPIFTICVPSSLTEVPQNYIILGIFTFAMSYIVAVICSFYNPQIVFMAAFMTMAMACALTLYAITTKTDFSMKGGLIFILGCCIFMFGIFTLFTYNKTIHIIYCICCIFLYGIYLIYDTQIVVGKHQEMITNDDYILGAMMLYTDIICLFLEILKLLGLSKDS